MCVCVCVCVCVCTQYCGTHLQSQHSYIKMGGQRQENGVPASLGFAAWQKEQEGSRLNKVEGKK